mgnify:FL=1
MCSGKIAPEKWKVLKGFHNEVVGHNGVQATCDKLQQAGYDWEEMESRVKKFISECDCCKKSDARRIK